MLILPQERDKTNVPISLPLHDRSFDLVLLSNWEDQIIYEPENTFSRSNGLPENNLTTPANKALESGAWTQSIIWSPRAPFRDFTQLEFNHEDDIIPEDRTGLLSPFLQTQHSINLSVAEMARPRKRLRTDAGIRDKFNLSHDHFYEISKDGRHRVRQTFGQLSVEHAYPAQKLQLPFVRVHFSYLTSVFNLTSSEVQDPTVQTRGSFFPSPSVAVSFKYRITIQQGSHCQEKEG